MAILTSAFSYLGSYYGEANPSLQGIQSILCANLLVKLRLAPWYFFFFLGQNLYTRGNAASLSIMDKQIYRLIGKATTLAASVVPSIVL